MNKVLPTLPVSALRNNQAKILGGLEKSPMILTSHGYEAAVLVSPSRWNEMVDLINRLEDSQIIKSRSQEMDDDEASWFSVDEVEQQLKNRGLLDSE